jgi:Xaa-Pro aminopeptidase
MGEAAHFLPDYKQGRTIEAGDQIGFLIENCGSAGYYQEIARTIVLGKASSELRDTFAMCKAAQDYTISLCKPGALCSDVSKAYNAYMVEHGLPPEGRLYAHGHGYDLVERPLIRDDETMRMEAGMCFAIHPGVLNSSLFAVCCDNFLIEETGLPTRLHKTEQRVFEI